MEAVGIVGSCVALVQAGDRLLQLVAWIQRCSDIEKEIKDLGDDIYRLKHILNSARINMALHGPPDIDLISKSMFECEKVITSLEEVIVSSLRISDKFQGPIRRQAIRMRWIRRSQRVERLRARLRDALNSLLLCFAIASR